ncbi:TlpA family protein disulfide reductase [Kineobactrum salinum]|uniref:TlpA family protein disulfide reductase n=1 Tax=Kineobactrum salinum TaxID=2708301 RepID=A0A6C0U3Z1_9GAMM|nr:TlpA disulfide reductase family protein [Kineobactrum salinum]QIB66658.1 TlpA family protein disulfide reductase [Kineobactrum salinum]
MMKLLAVALTLLLAGCQPTPPDDAALLQSLRGQWVVINYWAQWCKPCIEEIPELNALDQNYDTVAVLGVNYDGATGDELQRQVGTLGVAFPTLQDDPAALLGQPRPTVLPTTLILDPDGEVVATLVGPQTLDSLTAATVGRQPG